MNDLDAVVHSLQDAGFALDHWGGQTALRRSACAVNEGGAPVEFVEYRTASAAGASGSRRADRRAALRRVNTPQSMALWRAFGHCVAADLGDDDGL